MARDRRFRYGGPLMSTIPLRHALIPLLIGSTLLPVAPAFAAVAVAPVYTDVADGKPTFGDTAFGAPTSRGNDGVASPDNWTHADYPTSATPYPGEGANAPNPYWEVDLQGSHDLDNIVITDRIGCCDPSRLDGSIVTLFNGSGGIIGTEMIAGIAGTTGSRLTFDNGGGGYTGVARVRIDGVNGGAPIQYFQFSEFDANVFEGATAPINFAAGAPVSLMDASGVPAATWPGFPAANITDGVLSSITHPQPQAATGFYFEIDLGQEILVDNFDITGRGFRDACCPERLEDWRVEFLDGDGMTTFSYDHTGQTVMTDNIDVIGMTGGFGPAAQFVRVINANGADYGPQIGEFALYGVPVPEPGVAGLAAMAACAAAWRRRRRSP